MLSVKLDLEVSLKPFVGEIEERGLEGGESSHLGGGVGAGLRAGSGGGKLLLSKLDDSTRGEAKFSKDSTRGGATGVLAIPTASPLVPIPDPSAETER